MRSLLFWVVFGVVTTACKPSPSTTTVSPSEIWDELLEAGCVAPDDGGAASVQQQESLDASPWLSCMAAGGTVQSCNAPCSDD